MQFVICCNTRQNTAVRCNFLQRTLAPRQARGACNLLHTATHGKTMELAAMRCNTLQLTATHCNSLYRPSAGTCCRQSGTRFNSPQQHTATRCITPLQARANALQTRKNTATHCNSLQPTVSPLGRHVL